MIMGLILVGLHSHSISVLATSGDYAADSAAIFLGLIAIQIGEHPNGNPIATLYVAFINSFVLFTFTTLIIIGALHRLNGHTKHIQGLSVLVVSIVAAFSMLIGALILGPEAATEDLHMRSVWLDTVSDGVTSGLVAISGLIIWRTHKFFWLDSVLAIVIGIVICASAVNLMRNSIKAIRTF